MKNDPEDLRDDRDRWAATCRELGIDLEETPPADETHESPHGEASKQHAHDQPARESVEDADEVTFSRRPQSGRFDDTEREVVSGFGRGLDETEPAPVEEDDEPNDLEADHTEDTDREESTPAVMAGDDSEPEETSEGQRGPGGRRRRRRGQRPTAAERAAGLVPHEERSFPALDALNFDEPPELPELDPASPVEAADSDSDRPLTTQDEGQGPGGRSRRRRRRSRKGGPREGERETGPQSRGPAEAAEPLRSDDFEGDDLPEPMDSGDDAEEPRFEEPRRPEPRAERGGRDEPRRDEPRRGDSRRGNPRREEYRRDEPERDELEDEELDNNPELSDHAPDDDDDDESFDTFANWNVPSWNELIASLYRPER